MATTTTTTTTTATTTTATTTTTFILLPTNLQGPVSQKDLVLTRMLSTTI